MVGGHYTEQLNNPITQDLTRPDLELPALLCSEARYSSGFDLLVIESGITTIWYGQVNKYITAAVIGSKSQNRILSDIHGVAGVSKT
jgi:hypothetical protein